MRLWARGRATPTDRYFAPFAAIPSGLGLPACMCATPSGTDSSRGLHLAGDRRMLPDLFFDWLAPNHPVLPIFGGVPDSILGWSAPLPVESCGSLVNSPAKKSNGKTEEMPLAA